MKPSSAKARALERGGLVLLPESGPFVGPAQNDALLGERGEVLEQRPEVPDRESIGRDLAGLLGQGKRRAGALLDRSGHPI